MEKRISYTQMQSVKAVAKACDPIIKKRDTLMKKMEELATELRGYQTQVDALEKGIVEIIGFHVGDLVKKVIEPTGAVDQKTGKPIKVTKFITTNIVRYDENTKQYVITTPDTEAESNIEPIETEAFL